jgi:hypothetical protein
MASLIFEVVQIYDDNYSMRFISFDKIQVRQESLTCALLP